jgi:signal transduction histidine kinase
VTERLALDTEDGLGKFSGRIATAIANGDSSKEAEAVPRTLERVAAEEAALRRLATLVAQGAEPTAIFTAVSVEVDRLFNMGEDRCEVAGVVRFDPGPEHLVVGLSRTLDAVPLGSRWPALELYAPTRVLQTGRSARVDEGDVLSIGGPEAEFLLQEGYRSQVASPILVGGRLWGAVTVNAGTRLPRDTEQRLEKFTELVGTAIANAESHEALSALANEQAALRRVATLVARDAPSTEVFAAVATEVGKLFDTDITVVGRYDADGAATAIGNWNASGRGVPMGTRSAIGGRNVLTMVAETGRPARIDGYEDASGEAAEIARRYGWRSSIAAPIVVGDRLWGVMLVATERPEAFAVGAEERLAAFTDLVATAVANAQAHDKLRGFADEQAALGRVATLVAGGAPPEQVFTAVVDEVSCLLGLARIELVRYGKAAGTVIAAAGEHPFSEGTVWALDDPSVMATVFRTGRAARIDDYSTLTGEIAHAAREGRFQLAIGAPITVDGRLWGVIIAISTGPEPFPQDTELRLERFAELVGTAVSNASTRAELIASRARIVAAGDDERRRIERDLHDGMQQRLVSLGLAVRAAEASLPREQQEPRDELLRVATGLADAVEDLQEISRGIHPAILSKGGLGPALKGLAHRSAIPVDLDIATDVRLPESIEVAAYFVASEALANAAKHSEASRIYLSLRQQDGNLSLAVRDDGAGGADAARGSGLVGLIDRVEALGGSITIQSPEGEGTLIRVELPVELPQTERGRRDRSPTQEPG